MLAILVAFGAALFIWFHDDASPKQVDMACHIPEVVVTGEEPITFDFTQQVFNPTLVNDRDIP